MLNQQIYLRNLIRKNSDFLSIAQFMDFALYNKEYGYYMNNNPIGKKGDFITAPEISQLFAETIAIWIILQWEKLGQPTKFTIVELGPGNGTMMSDIIRVTKKYFFDYVDIYLLEISPTLRNFQKNTLHQYKSNVTWCSSIDELPHQPTILIANEFFDAFPIRQFIYKNNWYEKGIISDNNKLSFSLKSTNKSFGIVKKNSVVEINEKANLTYNKIKDNINCNTGSALIIDYGYIKKPYISTLQAIKTHKYHNILKDIGETDITAHVDFSIFANCKILTQREFLYLHGIKERAGTLLKKANIKEAQEIMRALNRLTHPESMGELFKCLIYTNI